jgi:hypothetical protein
VVALIVLVLLLLLLGGGGLLAPALHILWILLVVGLILGARLLHPRRGGPRRPLVPLVGAQVMAGANPACGYPVNVWKRRLFVRRLSSGLSS